MSELYAIIGVGATLFCALLAGFTLIFIFANGIRRDLKELDEKFDTLSNDLSRLQGQLEPTPWDLPHEQYRIE